MIAGGTVALSASACSVNTVNTATRPTPSPSDVQPSAAMTRPSAAGSPAPAATTFVAAVWPTAAQLPFAPVYHWTQQGPETTVTADGERLYTCDRDTAIPHLKATGYQTVRYQRDPATTNAGLSVSMLFFPDSASARHALDQIRADYTSCSANPPRDTVTGETLTTHVTQTITSDDSVAYVHIFRRSDNAPGSPEGIASDTHEYFSQHGNVIAFVRLSGGPAIDTHAQDQQILQGLSNRLSTYQ
jgi:hypothetical protein